MHWWNQCCGTRQMTMPGDFDEYSPEHPQARQPGSKAEMLSMPERRRSPLDSRYIHPVDDPLDGQLLPRNRLGKPPIASQRIARQTQQNGDIVVPSPSLKNLGSSASFPQASTMADGVFASFRGGQLVYLSKIYSYLKIICNNDRASKRSRLRLTRRWFSTTTDSCGSAASFSVDLRGKLSTAQRKQNSVSSRQAHIDINGHHRKEGSHACGLPSPARGNAGFFELRRRDAVEPPLCAAQGRECAAAARTRAPWQAGPCRLPEAEKQALLDQVSHDKIWNKNKTK